jgi:hypothetical protein
MSREAPSVGFRSLSSVSCSPPDGNATGAPHVLVNSAPFLLTRSFASSVGGIATPERCPDAHVASGDRYRAFGQPHSMFDAHPNQAIETREGAMRVGLAVRLIGRCDDDASRRLHLWRGTSAAIAATACGATAARHEPAATAGAKRAEWRRTEPTAAATTLSANTCCGARSRKVGESRETGGRFSASYGMQVVHRRYCATRLRCRDFLHNVDFLGDMRV